MSVENVIHNKRAANCFSSDNVLYAFYENMVPCQYEKHVILGNKCPSFINMRCIFEGEDTEIFHITGGLFTFDQYIKYKVHNVNDFLNIILNILYSVKTCSDYMISPDELALDYEHIFFSDKDESAKFLYIPGLRTGTSLREIIVMLVDRAEDMCPYGMLKGNILADLKNRFFFEKAEINQLIAMTEEAVRKTYHQEISEQRFETLNESQSEKSLNHDMAKESPSVYSSSGIKKHLKNLFNEFVS